MIFVYVFGGSSLEALWALLDGVLLRPRLLAPRFLPLVLVADERSYLVVVETLLREAAGVVLKTALRVLLRHGTLLGGFGARPPTWIGVRFVKVHVPGGHVFGILVAQQLVLRGDALGAAYALLMLLRCLFQIFLNICVQVLLFEVAQHLLGVLRLLAATLKVVLHYFIKLLHGRRLGLVLYLDGGGDRARSFRRGRRRQMVCGGGNRSTARIFVAIIGRVVCLLAWRRVRVPHDRCGGCENVTAAASRQGALGSRLREPCALPSVPRDDRPLQVAPRCLGRPQVLTLLAAIPVGSCVFLFEKGCRLLDLLVRRSRLWHTCLPPRSL